MWLFIAALAGLLLAGAIYEALERAQDPERYPAPGRLITVGDLTLHVHCTGKGNPVIVFESGLGDSSLVWADLQERLASRHRVCSYDRAGIAWSERDATWDWERGIHQLRSLLQAAGEKPPYVLVGHSSGVNWVRLYAHTYPNEVAALVLIEPPILEAVPGTMIALLKAARLGIGALSRVGIVRLLGRLGWMGVLTAGSPPPAPLQAAAGWLYNDHSIQGALSEIDALPAAITEMNQRAQPGALGHIPVRVVVAEPTVNAKAGLMAGWQRILALSDRAELVMGHGSHFLHYDQPELIVECIEGAVEASRR